ncbi:hypothetical protein DTO280E4_2741 [Paecilomyces variotii]|nr:hypothetical protein DTO169E5_3558 [Paecilomyces variotii]KAJ9363333.1 hypothetical protein DTO280E4_2741 [Paecilomyces variotii]KAJ9387529.1 hypothetical protein DTO063F5_3093 [Paecilomyces variotii]
MERQPDQSVPGDKQCRAGWASRRADWADIDLKEYRFRTVSLDSVTARCPGVFCSMRFFFLSSSFVS